MKLRGPRSALRAWWATYQRERARVTAERRSWHEAYRDFAGRVHGWASFEKGLFRETAEVRAQCADWLFVLVGTHVRETYDESGGTPERWTTSAKLRFRSPARGRHSDYVFRLGTTDEFIGSRTPSSRVWDAITGRDTVWELRYSESFLVTDVDRLVRLYEAFETTMRYLRSAGEAEPGSPG